MNFSILNTTTSSVNITRSLPSDIIYITISVISSTSAFILNCLVMIHSIRNRRNQNATSHLIRNLIMANILSSFIWIIIMVIMIKAKQAGWPLTLMHYTCQLGLFFWLICYTASVATLTLVSIERYHAIIHPTRPRLQGFKLNSILVIIWVSSIIVPIPILFVASVDKVLKFDCMVSIENSSSFFFFHIIFIDIVDYLLPSCIMIYCYVRVVKRLKQTSINALRNKKSISAGERRKKQVVKKLICLTICFIATALPWIYSFNLPLIRYNESSTPPQGSDLHLEYFIQLIPLLFYLSLFYDPIFYIVNNRNGGNNQIDNSHSIANRKKFLDKTSATGP